MAYAIQLRVPPYGVELRRVKTGRSHQLRYVGEPSDQITQSNGAGDSVAQYDYLFALARSRNDVDRLDKYASVVTDNSGVSPRSMTLPEAMAFSKRLFHLFVEADDNAPLPEGASRCSISEGRKVSIELGGEDF